MNKPIVEIKAGDLVKVSGLGVDKVFYVIEIVPGGEALLGKFVGCASSRLQLVNSPSKSHWYGTFEQQPTNDGRPQSFIDRLP